MNSLTTIGNALRRFVRFLARFHYPSLEVSGRERIPPSGPVLFVANHPNSMLDPALVGLTAARPVHFLAKAPLFDIPVFGALMRALGMVPAYRGRDDPAQVGRNVQSLDAAARWLARGEAVGIFPEGKSHDQTRVEQVRGGASRVALQATVKGAPVVIVPLGLNYECKERFRSAAWVRVGQTIDVAAVLREYGDDERQATRALTALIDRSLKAAVVHLEEDQWASFLPDLEVLLPAPPEFAQVPAAPLRQRKRIADAMNHFLATDRPRAEAMAAAIEQHRAALAAAGLGIRSAVMRLRGRRLLLWMTSRLAWLTVSLAPALAGIVHHMVPFVVTRSLAVLCKQPGRMTLALTRLLIGLPIYALWYALGWWLLAGWFEPWIATLWTALMPLAGLRALLFLRLARDVIPAFAREVLLFLRPRRLRELRRQQLDLRHELRLLAAEYARLHARADSFA